MYLRAVLLNKTATDILSELATALGKQACSKCTMEQWVESIQEGRVDVKELDEEKKRLPKNEGRSG